MVIGFVILGAVGGAIGALVALLLDSSPLLVALTYSVTGSLTALIASLVYVVASGRRRRQDKRRLVKPNYRFE